MPSRAWARPGTSPAPAGTVRLDSCKILADGLEAAAQMLCQKCLGYGVEGEPVLGTGKSMTLVCIKHIGHRKSLGLHGFDDLVGLILLDARIVGSLADEQGPLNSRPHN